MSASGVDTGLLLPDVYKFAFNPGDIKFVRKGSVSGTPVFHYQFNIHAGDMTRSIEFWIGVNDHLPRRTYMSTVTTMWDSPLVVWHENSSCDYNVAVQIERPM